jgi:hypothetical protein
MCFSIIGKPSTPARPADRRLRPEGRFDAFSIMEKTHMLAKHSLRIRPPRVHVRSHFFFSMDTLESWLFGGGTSVAVADLEAILFPAAKGGLQQASRPKFRCKARQLRVARRCKQLKLKKSAPDLYARLADGWNRIHGLRSGERAQVLGPRGRKRHKNRWHFESSLRTAYRQVLDRCCKTIYVEPSHTGRRFGT